MNNSERIINEWLGLKDSSFWVLYNAELEKFMSTRLDKLRSGAIDTILHTQGEVKSLEFVKGLPDRIMSELKSKGV